MDTTLRAVLRAVLMVLATNSVADNMDVVHFDNGNVLIGEIKKLERGKLYFDTDSTGVVQIEWDKVTSLVSQQNLQFETTSGLRHLGMIAESKADQTLTVEEDNDVAALPLETVVRMRPIESKVRERIDLAVHAGANYNKASDVAQFNLGMEAEYRTEKRFIELELDSTVTDNNNETTERQNLVLNFQALRDNRWFTGGIFKLQKNEELDLDLRTSLGGGIGHTLLETGSQRVQMMGGLLLNRENFEGPGDSSSNVEGLFSLSYDWFRFSSPEIDINSTLALFPGITESGRFRGEFDITVRWEIVEDLFWQLDFYNNYDSDANSKHDNGVSTSLGYEF